MADETEGDFWRDVRPAMQEASKQRKAANRAAATKLLKAAGLAFESKNDGAHLVVRDNGMVFDFWPGTGLWQMRGARHQRRGVHALLKTIGKEPTNG